MLSVPEICPASGQIVLCPRVSLCFERGFHVIQTTASVQLNTIMNCSLGFCLQKRFDYRHKLPRDLMCASEHVCCGACVDLFWEFRLSSWAPYHQLLATQLKLASASVSKGWGHRPESPHLPAVKSVLLAIMFLGILSLILLSCKFFVL